jgi:peptide/nickel transport system permease protein
LTLAYVLKRLGLFLAVVWAAATLNFVIPRLARGRDPVREKLGQLAATGGLHQEGVEELVRSYEAKFGLDRPLVVQYLSYLWKTVRLDLGYSLANYPARVGDLIARAMPWTLGLLLTATLLSFAAGTLVGGLAAWPGSPRALKALALPVMSLSAIPYYMLGLVLIYVFAVVLRVFPVSGGHSAGPAATSWASSALDCLGHSILPALSIVVSATGFWALGMRGMMVTTRGEDYVAFAEAAGLPGRTVFLRYALRNALLPQVTALALAIGFVVSGSVLVEVVFLYPGMGTLLFRAISVSDYALIHGIVFIVILAVGLATLAVDLLYPLLDPRIRYGGEGAR